MRKFFTVILTLLFVISFIGLVACEKGEHQHVFYDEICKDCPQNINELAIKSYDMSATTDDNVKGFLVERKDINENNESYLDFYVIGSGDIINYDYTDFPPYFSEYGKRIRNLYISNNVTSIGNFAFAGCNSLISATIGDSVTSIGCAFYGCSSLTSITIPNSVTSIGRAAFNSCKSLTSITIGGGVISIGDMAFYGCSSLTKVNYLKTIDQWAQIEFEGGYSNPLSYAKNLYINNQLVTEANITTATKISDYAFYNYDSLTSVAIGNSVTSIGYWAFCNCLNLTSIVVKEDNDTYKSIDGNLYSKDEKTIIQYAPGKTATTFAIPNSVTSISDSAFAYCSSLATITMPNSVTSIGDDVFYGSKSLTKVNYIGTIDQWVQIEFDSFYSNPLYYAKNLYINNQLVTEANITTATKISDYVFYNCYSLTSIVIPNSVTSIGDWAFYCCYKLVEVINNSPHITIEKGSSSNGYLGYYALDVYNSEDTFTETKLSNDNGYIIYTDGEEKILVGYNGTDTDLVLPTYITKINQYAFYGCDSLTSATIGNNVTSIGNYAFNNCYSLTSVTIGDSVTWIGNDAFSHCERLVEVYNLSKLIINVGLRSNGKVGYYAKVIHTDLSEASILTTDSEGFVTFNDNGVKTIISYVGNKTEITIPNDIQRIHSYAFYNCKSLISVIIPNSVTSIWHNAFNINTSQKNKTLKHVIFENINNWKAQRNFDSDSYIDFDNNWLTFAVSYDPSDSIQFINAELADSEIAAKYLRDTYLSYNWYRE